MSEQNPLQKIDDEVIEQINQEWSAWSVVGILSLVSMPLCLIGAFLHRDNQSLFAVFVGATICLIFAIAISFKKGTDAADKSLSMLRNLPSEEYGLTIFIELESEGPDTFLGLLQSPTDSFWIHFSGTQEQKKRLRELQSTEGILVGIQKSNDVKGPILVTLKGTEFRGSLTNKRGNQPPKFIENS